jgi:hypothetical protein
MATKVARDEAIAQKKDSTTLIVCHKKIQKHDIFLEAFISKGGLKGTILGTDSITPHGDDPLKNPIPLPFLKVRPKVEFTFQFLLHDALLDEQTTITVEKKLSAFESILTTFGAGAKTNVGYGQFVGKTQGNVSAPDSPTSGTSSELIKPTEAQQFLKKAKLHESLQAKVISKGQVEIRTTTETIIAKICGNYPEIGAIVHATINIINSKTKKIESVRYDGPVN